MKVILWIGAALMALTAGAVRAEAEEAVWSVAGKQVLRLRATAGGLTPVQRVEELDHRLNNILSKENAPLRGDDIVLKHEKGAFTILVRGDLLVTIDPRDAAANHQKPEKLGLAWLSNLRKTLPLVAPRVNRHGV